MRWLGWSSATVISLVVAFAVVVVFQVVGSKAQRSDLMFHSDLLAESDEERFAGT